MKANAGFLAIFNRCYFIDDAEVTVRAGMPIGTPADALARMRQQLTHAAT
jgi:hypothetical protein